MQFLTNANAFPQYIVSKINKTEDGRTDKVPCNPRGSTASHKDPKNWLTLEWAQTHVDRLGPDYRVGFSITRETKLFFIDIDGCFVNGVISPLGHKILSTFFVLGCAVEKSQSGNGLHVFGRYSGELPPHLNKNSALKIELYTHDRFVMFGGIDPCGDWNVDATEALHALIAEYFAAPVSAPVVESVVPVVMGDEEIIAKCRAKTPTHAQAVFGKGASFNDLYDGNLDVLIEAYPSQSEGKLYNGSAADLALANMIVVHTSDVEQVIRIMKSSKLAREKWDSNRTYLPNTVSTAISDRRSTQGSRNQSNDSTPVCQEDNEYEGCFYVVAEREIYSTRYGLLNQDGFNMCFGGPYLKEPPYKTFKGLAKQNNLIVGRLGFRPDLPHGSITEREGITSVNTYKPLNIKMHSGDMEPFWRFFKAMIPNERDQRILLTYAAVLAQKPGVKSQWCAVLQGVQGCGKSMFADFVAYACGEKYTHRAKGDEFENRFNAQWFGKTLILVEDPQLRYAKLEEILKPLVTSSTLSFEGKGKNAHMGEFPANFILTLNDFDAIQKRADTRRLAVFMSALQTPEDLVNVGLTPGEYRRIIAWRDSGGYEIFAHYIHNYIPDPEFDFSGNCVTAPLTSTTDLAIESSRTEIEVLLLEEIGSGRIGFKGGWISSIALTDFLIQRRITHLLPDSKRGRILQSLGYKYHPGLSDGRTSRNVIPDNKRPRLFVKINHPTFTMTDVEAITRGYEEAQK